MSTAAEEPTSPSGEPHAHSDAQSDLAHEASAVVHEPPAQPTAPYLDAVTAYGFRGSTRFHVPGHKGGAGADPGMHAAFGLRALLLDVPQDIEGIDIGPSPTPYERAERLAAEAYGAARTWFLTNGASQGNHALCLALAGPRQRVVIQRNSHASLIDGLVLSGGLAAFVPPEYDAELGMAHGVTPDTLERVLRKAPDAGAAFIVSPTYYGMAADVEGCAEVAHRAGAALIVDNAWGAHFGFHPSLPQSPLRLGADAMVASTHKIVGSLTQSAMLLVAHSDRIDVGAIGRAVRLVRSTSQSALLMASLDAARRQLAVHGEALLEQTIGASARARAAIDAVPGCSVVNEGFVGRPGIAGWDPLRIVIDVAWHRLHGIRAGGGPAFCLRHLHRARDPRDARPRAGPRPADRPAGAIRSRLRGDRPPDVPPRRGNGARAAAGGARARDRDPAARGLPRRERSRAG